MKTFVKNPECEACINTESGVTESVGPIYEKLPSRVVTQGISCQSHAQMSLSRFGKGGGKCLLLVRDDRVTVAIQTSCYLTKYFQF